MYYFGEASLALFNFTILSKYLPSHKLMYFDFFKILGNGVVTFILITFFILHFFDSLIKLIDPLTLFLKYNFGLRFESSIDFKAAK